MKIILINLFLLISMELLAQNAELRGTLDQDFSDLGTIKIQAEQGNWPRKSNLPTLIYPISNLLML
jgi:hypothetical protein